MKKTERKEHAEARQLEDITSSVVSRFLSLPKNCDACAALIAQWTGSCEKREERR